MIVVTIFSSEVYIQKEVQVFSANLIDSVSIKIFSLGYVVWQFTHNQNLEIFELIKCMYEKIASVNNCLLGCGKFIQIYGRIETNLHTIMYVVYVLTRAAE